MLLSTLGRFGHQASANRCCVTSCRPAHSRAQTRRSGPIAFTQNPAGAPVNDTVLDQLAKLQASFAAQQHEQARLRADHESLRADHERLGADHERLGADHESLREEVEPLQEQFVFNVVHQVAKFAVTSSKPTSKPAQKTFIDKAPDAQVQSLAMVLHMDSQEFKNQLRPLALQRNLAQHPCSLKVLRKSVAKAVNVCGKRPKDKNLAFALRFLCAYPAIESTFLL